MFWRAHYFNIRSSGGLILSHFSHCIRIVWCIPLESFYHFTVCGVHTDSVPITIPSLPRTIFHSTYFSISRFYFLMSSSFRILSPISILRVCFLVLYSHVGRLPIKRTNEQQQKRAVHSVHLCSCCCFTAMYTFWYRNMWPSSKEMTVTLSLEAHIIAITPMQFDYVLYLQSNISVLSRICCRYRYVFISLLFIWRFFISCYEYNFSHMQSDYHWQW